MAGTDRQRPILAYDAACLHDGGGPPKDRLATIKQPVLVLTGKTIDSAMAGLASGFFDDAADALVAAVRGPSARKWRRAALSRAAAMCHPANLDDPA
ncbi:hypothetical protein [Amycolatopsis sp. NPDC051061]|uniref:hypothetical protein n=1 Tax=Amycolatopsis sp. NPDC051061 TaxID=3155042 RepID=UPI003414A110